MSPPDAIQDSLELLKRSVREEIFHFVIVVYDHPAQVDLVQNFLQSAYPERKSSAIYLEETDYESFLKQFLRQNEGFIFLRDFEYLLKDPGFGIGINQRRDRLSQFPVSLVAFVPKGKDTMLALMKAMPDLWSIRRRIVELPEWSAPVNQVQLEYIEPFEKLNFQEIQNTIRTAVQRIRELRRLNLPDSDGLLVNLYELAIRNAQIHPSFSHLGLKLAQEYASFLESRGLPPQQVFRFKLKVGHFLRKEGRLRESIELFNSVLLEPDLPSEIQGVALMERGYAHFIMGKFLASKEDYVSAQSIFKTIGSFELLAEVYRSKGQLYLYMGEAENAAQSFRDAREIYQSFHNTRRVADCHWREGEIAFYQGDVGKAEDHFQKAMSLFEEHGENLGVAQASLRMGILKKSEGKLDAAERQVRWALAKFEGEAHAVGKADCLRILGTIKFEKKDIEAAQGFFLQAKEIYESEHNLEGLAGTYLEYAVMYRDQNKTDEALSALKEAQILSEKSPDPMLKLRVQAELSKWGT